MTDPALTKPTDDQQSPSVFVGTGVGGKEIESAPPQGLEVPALKEIGRELPLSAEVSQVGVKIHPTSVTLPQSVTEMGVTTVGQSTPPPAISVTLPLTDDQIAAGLHQSITSSLRWLSEWCVRKLKQFHLGLKAIHGKMTRVKQ